MSDRSIDPVRVPLDAELRAPASKSITHRALVAAALAAGRSVLSNPLDAADSRATREGLARLGIDIRVEPERWTVEGSGGEIRGGGTLTLGESGTSMRLLTAVAALGSQPSRLDGSRRLRERPLEELAVALGRLGGAVRGDPQTGGLPIEAGGAPISGGQVRIPGRRSSQFASALLMIGPVLAKGLELTIEPPAVSLPYVEMTADVLGEFGARVDRLDELSWRVQPGPCRGREFVIEGDHSAASYFLVAAAVAGGRVRVSGLRAGSRQPDARLGEILRGCGCRVEANEHHVEVVGTGQLAAFDLDLADSPDLAPAVAILALFADGPSVIRGVSHLRYKESDRLEMLARNLRALGRHAMVIDDRLVISPPPPCLGGAPIETASDHRIAMAFAVAGLRIEGIRIDNAECVGKSNPDFWEQFRALTR